MATGTPISGIYCIRNIINGKIYIGQSKSCVYRWREHKSELRGGYHGNSYLQASFDKYGEEAFEYSILEECEESRRDEREMFWIDQYNSTNRDFGFNRLFGGCLNKNHSQETKDVISKALKEKGIKPPSQSGQKWSEERRLKMSALMSGRKLAPCSEEKKEMLRVANLGKVASEEAKRKMSEKSKGNTRASGSKRTDEFKQAVSLFQKGRPKPEETKKRMKAAQRKRFQTQEQIELCAIN